jgi:endoglucanase
MDRAWGPFVELPYRPGAPMVQTPSSPIRVAISGKRWWKGFTAELTITNTSGQDLTSWSTTFDTPHRITGTPWGVAVGSVDLGNGLTRYTLTGTGWGAALKAGASVKVGFNGSQGIGIGNEGALTADLFLASGTAPAPGPSTEPPPTPPLTPAPAPDPLRVTVGGTRWWNGFTAELTITNSSSQDLTSWSTSFDSPHQVSGAPWGATLSRVDLGAGLSRYTLTGTGWAAGLKAGASVKVGFSGSQGISIGNEGALSAAQLFGTVAPPAPPLPPSPPPPSPPVVPPTPTPSPTPGQGYGEALRLSFLFYEAQRSGDLDEATNRVTWRGDSGLRDGRDGVYFGDRTAANLQAGLSLDLTGGYHDAGDHGKFGLPLATTLTTLAWGGLAFERSYAASGQLDELLSSVKWGTDYLLKAHGTDAGGNTRYFVAQVGDVAADHALWSAPETQTIARPAMAVTPSKPGSDVAAGSAAALASASILFRRNGEVAYADTLLSHAESLYRFADTYRGKYSDSLREVRDYYNSWSGYNDELSYGAAWLARAREAAGGDGSAYRNQALQIYRQSIGGLSRGWTINWDDVSYGTAVLLAQDTGDTRILGDVRGWLDSWVQGTNGVSITSGGLRHISQWGSLRYAANTAMVAGVVADSLIDPGGTYSKLATDTIDYILGDNPRGSSYVVGYGTNAPQQPHHRGASGVGWEEFRNGLPNVHTLHGALVGGPDRPNDFSYADVRSDYIRNEVAIDYNAGFSGALAYLSQPPVGL